MFYKKKDKIEIIAIKILVFNDNQYLSDLNNEQFNQMWKSIYK